MLLKTASRAPLYEELLRRGQEERAAQAEEAQRQRALEDEERRYQRSRRDRLADDLAGEERAAQAEEVKRGQLMDRRRTPGTPEFAQAQGEAEAQFKRALRPVVGGQTVRLSWNDYAPFLGMEDMPDAEEDGIEFSYDKTKNRAHVRVLDRAGQTLFEQPIDNAAEQLRNWGVEVKEPEVETDLDRLEKKARRVRAEKTLAGEDGAAGGVKPSAGYEGFWRDSAGRSIPVTIEETPQGIFATYLTPDEKGNQRFRVNPSALEKGRLTRESHQTFNRAADDAVSLFGKRFDTVLGEDASDDDAVMFRNAATTAYRELLSRDASRTADRTLWMKALDIAKSRAKDALDDEQIDRLILALNAD